ncbi:nucleic acid-binding, OB-fold protein [Artemisia annua]|uniref:Nucleic acid-binding, OB-fold protein n=1 Tax=Artemisia annua TaxID=35608 RepID=A0A2U1QF03_ARTAN|nr:nucleic acid-binding, OB-fold protein [Artemisia annua]
MADKGKESEPQGTGEGIGSAGPSTLERSPYKGKAPADESDELDLMNIKPSDMEKLIEVKVYRKWTSKNVPDPNPTGLCFILLDRKGSAIQANVQLWDMRQFDSRLQVGSCYRIERFGCKNTENWQRTLPNPITLLLGRYTQVTQIEGDFPEHYFRFTAYNEVGQRADTRDYTLTGTGNTIGVYSDSITDNGNPNDITMYRLHWDCPQSGFPVQTINQIEQPVVIAVSSCWARRYSGGLQLSSTPATYYYLNPQLEEAERIREAYNSMMGQVPWLHIPVPAIEAPNQQAQRQITPLSVLMQTSLESLVQQFTVQAMVLNIDEQMAWYFNRCRTCGNKVSETMPHRHCQQPGMPTVPNYSYCFRMTLGDDTGTIILTCFSPEANTLLASSTVTDLLSYIPEPNPYEIPAVIYDLQNTTHIFHVHLAKGSRRGFPRYILDGAEDAPLPALPPVPQQPHEIIPAQVIETTPQVQEAEQVVPSTSTYSENLQETERPSGTSSITKTPTATEIMTTDITPPPFSEEQSQVGPVHTVPESSSVRRQLFVEEEQHHQQYGPAQSSLDMHQTTPQESGSAHEVPSQGSGEPSQTITMAEETKETERKSSPPGTKKAKLE